MTEYKLNPVDFSAAKARTALWLEQREKCLSCAHCLMSRGGGGETIMVCGETPATGMRYGAYCIDAREPEQSCGPDANLFQPKE